MTLPHFRYNSNQEPPLAIFIERRDKTRDGHWRPRCFCHADAQPAHIGFSFALPPDDLKSFLLLLTFLTPNGGCAPILPQLAAAFQLSEGKARARLERLMAARWHGQSLVVPYHTGNGTDAFMPTPGLLSIQEREDEQPASPLYTAAPREVVIEHSRRTYGRPRAEVERQIAEQMGLKPEAETKSSTMETPVAPPQAESRIDEPDVALRVNLLRAGLRRDQADALIARFPESRIRRQLMWLPYHYRPQPRRFSHDRN